MAKTMKVLHLSFSDDVGGAARAAYRIHKALQKSGLDSVMYVCDRNTEDATVIGPDSFTAKGAILF